MAKMITKQKGATTILIALLLLLISTAVTLYVGKVTTNETRLRSDNSQRIESYNNAMTGFYQAVSCLKSNKKDPDNCWSDISNGSAYPEDLSTTQFDSVVCAAIDTDGAFIDNPISPCNVPVYKASDSRVMIYSTGKSEIDSEAKHYVLALVGYQSAGGGNLESPVVGANKIDVSGSASLSNPDGSINIWSGKPVTIGNGNSDSLDTEIKSPDPSAEAGTTVIASSGKEIGVDVIQSDINLHIDPDGPEKLFRNFFGSITMDDYKKAFVNEEYDTDANPLSLTDPDGEENRRIIWVDASSGPLKLSGGDNIVGLGEKEEVILIVDGDLEIQGGIDFKGIVFVTGNFTGGGSIPASKCKDAVDACAKIEGGIIVAGETSMSGNISVSFSRTIIDEIKDDVEVQILPGGWKDWSSY